MTALDDITRRGQLATGFVAPRSGDVTIAAAGLERMRRLVDALGNPQRAYRTIHVAGSKGKGSTVAYASAILTATGRKTGRYTSPHLMDWRERIAVDGVDISHQDFDRVIDYVDSTMKRLEAERPDDPPHNAFELLTAAAFVHFAEVGCEAAVIEVGIGGRFDSTNLVDAAVSVITAIEAEHLDILGPTMRDVAWNKAGIMRPGRPCVAVAQQPEVAAVLSAQSKVVGSDLVLQGRDWWTSGTSGSFVATTWSSEYADLTISNPLPSQMTNAAASIVAVSLAIAPEQPTGEQMQAGLDAGSIPGRFEVIEGRPPVVLDVAHTADSIAVLGDGVRAAFAGRRIVLMVGILDDKDTALIATAVAGWADAVVATTAPSPRGRASSEIADALRETHTATIDRPSPSEAWTTAIQLAGDEGVVVGSGSFALVAHVRRIMFNRT